MAEIVADCLRCTARSITFDVLGSALIGKNYTWQRVYEVFCVCRACRRSTIFVVAQGEPDTADMLEKTPPHTWKDALNRHFKNEGAVTLKDRAGRSPPDFVPDPIKEVFAEGATCCSVRCWDAAGAMFRKAIDLASRPLLPAEGEPPPKDVRRNLGPRLKWLFDNGRLPEDLRGLATCIHQDGNDAAHNDPIGENAANDLLDFCDALLRRLYTEPARVKAAETRRLERRGKVG